MIGLDARIGTLLTEGRTVFYAFDRGYGQPETRGTLEQVERSLGILRASGLAATKRKVLRTFTVTVTPRLVTYGSHGANAEYTIDVSAASHADAIKIARQRRRDEDGRFAVPADYKARIS